MKAAIVTHVLSHFEVPLFRIAAELPGLEVRVLHLDSADDSFECKEHQTTVNWGESLRSGYPNTYFAAVDSLTADLFDWQPDVIVQYGYGWKGAIPLLLQARLRGVPVVHRGLTSIYCDPRANPRWAKAKRIARDAVLKQFDAHHFGGTYSWQVLEHIGVPGNRRYFVPFSVDTPFFDMAGSSLQAKSEAAALRDKLGWPQDAPVVLFLSNQAWVKGADIFMAAVALAQRERPELKILAVGSGPLAAEMKEKAAATLSPGSFHFPGFVPSKSTVPFYLASDVVLFPSRYDTWARAVNEAMICRRPCIASKWVAASGGLILHGKNGYVLGSLLPEDYARQLVAFLSLPLEGRVRMGQAARTRALEFSYEAHRDDLYRSLTEVAV